MKIVLIGYRGTGKTAVGQQLAALSHWSFRDTDDMVEQTAGRSIAEIFAQRGEVAFRDHESKAISEVSEQDQVVIATGGGAVLRAENRTHLRRDSFIVWLTASVETIVARVESDEATTLRRPNLTSAGGVEEIEQMLQARLPIYEDCHDLQLATDQRSPEELAARIWFEFQGRSGGRPDRAP